MGRSLVVGDIHGGYKALKEVIEDVDPAEDDYLIFLGDYVDGWSDSADVVAYLIALKKEHTCIFLRGNHDDLAAQWMIFGKSNEQWLNSGGLTTIESYHRYGQEDKEPHVDFFQSLINYHIDEKNRLFVHGGFSNLNGPSYEFYPNVVYWDRSLWEMALSLDQNLDEESPFYPERLKLFHEIYIGHTPTTRYGHYQPMNVKNLWNIDTGAAFKGSISIMDIDTKEVWQSTPVHELYPNENGRN